MFALQFNKLKESLSIQLLLFPIINMRKIKDFLKKIIFGSRVYIYKTTPVISDKKN